MTPAMPSDLVAGDSTGVRDRGDRLGRVEGSAIVEFAILGGVAVLITLAVVQLAVFLFQRNVVVTAVAEGARVGASFGRNAAEGRAAACELIRQAIGEHCRVLQVTAVERGGLVMVTADGTLPPLAPGLPGLHIRHVATMHDEEGFVRDLQPSSLDGLEPGLPPTHRPVQRYLSRAADPATPGEAAYGGQAGESGTGVTRAALVTLFMRSPAGGVQLDGSGGGLGGSGLQGGFTPRPAGALSMAQVGDR